ncbi:hypothetical protein L6164_018881 [Bauhinia variegata]|uniref:Uncharacterized protein n=1 Tax=Bauhinia variegata TaxID=167791 RepID=A0ACB9NE01_BAUVA|nr:hypothetical protein L6164_018881 [Bauhinia variegata]
MMLKTLKMPGTERQLSWLLLLENIVCSSGIAPADPHGYSSANNSSAPVGELQRGYSADHFDPYRERARFLGGGARDQGFEPRGAYPGGRVYDTGSRYYG